MRINWGIKMVSGLVGRKCGMTRIFEENGISVPVTVVHMDPSFVTQIKNIEKDGYEAVQLAVGKGNTRRMSKALQGIYKKANVEAASKLKEFSVDKIDEVKIGDSFTVEQFNDIKFVDVQGVSKGKGFAGVVKRHNFAMQDATHGNSLSHRAPGSIGQNQSPGRVFKGKKMAGHMGNKTCSVQNLELVRIDAERNLLMIKGGIPGSISGYVIVKPSVKKSGDTKK